MRDTHIKRKRENTKRKRENTKRKRENTKRKVTSHMILLIVLVPNLIPNLVIK